MFGAYGIESRLIHHNPDVPGDLERAGEAFADVLRSLPSIADNTALISHAANIARATGLRLAEGEIGVVRVSTDGCFTVVGSGSRQRSGTPCPYGPQPGAFGAMTG